MPQRTVHKVVADRARSLGAVGEAWLDGLDALVSQLEEKWHISVQETLDGGSHAYVARALSPKGAPSILKIELPDETGELDFKRAIEVLETAAGTGLVKLISYDLEKRACLLEQLGASLKDLEYPVAQQMTVICTTLKQVWDLPVKENSLLPSGQESIAWFGEFIPSAWETLGRPCAEKVLQQAGAFLRCRESRLDPAKWVLLHGDAHNANLLQDPKRQGEFRFIDGEGLFYEKAYDLGVLMREWPQEYQVNPMENGKKRCAFLSELTGVESEAIWQWGFLQTVSTALLLVQTGREELGRTMLEIAEQWC